MRLPDCRSWFGIPDYARYELFLIRGLFALVIWDAMPTAITIPTDPHPVGLGHWIDFSFLAEASVLAGCRWLLAVCLLLYAAGFLLCFSLPIILILLTAVQDLETFAAIEGWTR